MQKVSDSLAAFLVFASRFTFALTLSAHLFQFSAHTLFPLPAVFVITNGVPKDFIVKVFGVCTPEVMDQFAEHIVGLVLPVHIYYMLTIAKWQTNLTDSKP